MNNYLLIATFTLIFVIITWILIDFFRHPRKKCGNKITEEKILRKEEIMKGLDSEILKEGDGPGATVGKEITCQYIARLLSTGEIVDSSDQHGGAFTFKLGSRQVIPGWEKGLKGIKKGEKRRLKMESKHAYGGQGAGKIPPNEDLIFEIEVIKIQ